MNQHMSLANRIKIDGVWYWYAYRVSWDTRYYSFDNGAHWFKSKREAYQQAKASDALWVSDDQNIIGHKSPDLPKTV